MNDLVVLAPSGNTRKLGVCDIASQTYAKRLINPDGLQSITDDRFIWRVPVTFRSCDLDGERVETEKRDRFYGTCAVVKLMF